MDSYSGGLAAYWRRMRYQRLDDGGGGSRRWRTRRRTTHRRRVELASGAGGVDTASTKRRTFWRVKVAPRLGFLRRGVSPRMLLTRIRDAYVRMMLSLANSRVLSGGGVFGYSGGDITASGFGWRAPTEYDKKVIVEIYRSMVAQGRLDLAAAAAAAAARDGGGQTALIVPRRL